MTKIENIQQATAAFKTLRPFICASQIEAMADVCRGEERRYMFSKLVELVDTIATMHKTYETDGQGDAAIVRLHYFVGGCDWYITERDLLDEQRQAFGLADIGMGCPELGYISIVEITAAGAELDLHWTPKTLKEIKREREEEHFFNDPNSTGATMHY